MSDSDLNEPQVPISVFKANPIAYATTGAVVMVHNKPRLRVVPIAADPDATLAEVKARLRVLNALIDQADADDERRALAAERDADLLEDAQ
ncbi:MAG: hypothetical protein BGO47_04455 [Microbacterium sp. 67-17]|uniref:hypothetical protein n=1 Tax=Microbacterium sp. 67-17 TaxID=1895782 RepID=UPI000960FF9E|nr:hypothetical protein [Microbacterium sp. 67-17]OJV96366.1 MAG: hypothetical protein BGO47_04455 [Microbacterium sp. 67-17]